MTPNPSTPTQSLTASARKVLHHPGTRQLLGLGGVAAAIAIGITAWFWSQSGDGVPLFTGLSPSDEMAVVETLQARNIRYSRDATSGTILVPADVVHDLRLTLAAEGLPRGAGSGFELIRDSGGLGASPFMENARYQHVLETELGRTVAALHPVQSARVHLAMPRRSAFVRTDQTATAAVMVNLHPGRVLDQGQIAAIVHLVSSSVPQLGADKVSVVDQRGSLLNRPGRRESHGLDDEQLAFQERIEQRYVERIQQLLMPVAGANRISAQVSVELDFSRAEQLRETFDPTSSVLRSEQIAEENRAAGQAVGGIPGALANRPPTAADAAATPAAGNTSLQSTRNFELNRTVEQTWQNPGRVQRISAAVIVDHLPAAGAAPGEQTALTDQQLAQVEALVREAIGFDATRGDSVNVQNLRFQDAQMPALPAVPIWQQPMVQDLVRQLIGLAVLLFVAFRVFGPAVRAVLREPAALPGGAVGRTPLAVENSTPDAEEAAWASDELGQERPAQPTKPRISKHALFEEKLSAARTVVTNDPARVANVVRGWIADE